MDPNRVLIEVGDEGNTKPTYIIDKRAISSKLLEYLRNGHLDKSLWSEMWQNECNPPCSLDADCECITKDGKIRIEFTKEFEKSRITYKEGEFNISKMERCVYYYD